MIDISNTEVIKNHKNSFDKASNKIIKYIQDLKCDYNNQYNRLDTVKKDRNSLINELNQELKTLNLKSSIQLTKCNRDELNDEINKLLSEVSYNDKENIQILLLKINNRYDEMIDISNNLDKYANELSIIHLKEDDYDDEVVIDLSTTSNNIVEEEVENNSTGLDIRDELETKEIIEDNGEYISYTIKDRSNLKKISKKVYGNEKYWNNIYNYKDNKELLDGIARQNKVSINQVVEKYKFLDNITIKIPTEITTLEEEK